MIHKLSRRQLIFIIATVAGFIAQALGGEQGGLKQAPFLFEALPEDMQREVLEHTERGYRSLESVNRRFYKEMIEALPKHSVTIQSSQLTADNIENLKRLRSISLKINHIHENTMALIGHLPNTNVIWWDIPQERFDQLTDADFAHLEALKNLEGLFFGTLKVSDKILPHVARITSLKILFLMGAEITDTGIDHLKRLKNLQILGMLNTKMTDVGLAAIGELRNLDRLSIVNASISEVGLEHLVENLTKLQKLDLAGIQNIRQSWIDALKAKHAHINIEFRS